MATAAASVGTVLLPPPRSREEAAGHGEALAILPPLTVTALRRILPAAAVMLDDDIALIAEVPHVMDISLVSPNSKSSERTLSCTVRSVCAGLLTNAD